MLTLTQKHLYRNMSDVNTDSGKPPQWIIDLVKYAGESPWEFITTLLLILSPLFIISSLLAWKLSTLIEKKEKKEKKINKKIVNKLKKRKAD